MSRIESFAEGRQKAVAAFELAIHDLRLIALDPDWCTSEYPQYKRAVEGLFDSLSVIRRLNGILGELSR